MTLPTRPGMTVPLPGPLHSHREKLGDLADMGYTDIWSAEAEATVGRLEADIDRIVKASQRKVEDAKNAIGRDQILAEETARAAAAGGPSGPAGGR